MIGKVKLDDSKIYFEVKSGQVLADDIRKIENAFKVISEEGYNENVEMLYDFNDIPDRLINMKN